MRPSLLAVILAVAAVLAAVVAWSLRGPGASVGAESAAVLPESEIGVQTPSPLLQSSPQVREYRGRQRFEQRARSFVQRSVTMGAVARSEEARALEAELVARERAGEVSAGESMLLRVALVEATSTNDAERLQRAGALVERYRVDAQRREAAWATQLAHDRRFADYKAREQDVVAEVMAMRTIPGGASRDDYLRRRLQQERETAYAGRP